MGGPAIINGKPVKELDNFYICPFEYDGKIWQSSEQFYQASKFKDEDYKEEIRQSTNTHIAYMMGQSREQEHVDNFEESKVERMYAANLAKIYGNEEIKTKLMMAIGEIVLEKSSPFWNKANGEILQNIRDMFLLEDVYPDYTLFRQYEICFDNMNMDGMLLAEKEWNRLNPDDEEGSSTKKFHVEYGKYIEG